MKKNYFFSRLILAGVFTLTTATSFVGCKDYDDDISNLQTQITANTEAIKALEKLMGEGKYVTGVSKGADGSLTFTMSNGGSSITIPSVDGKDGSVITINEEGYWVIDGKATTVKAKGEKGDKGDQGDQGATGPQGPAGESAAKGEDGHSPKIVGGYWHVYDDEAGKYVPTDVVAQDVLTYVTDHDTYYTLNVAAKNADGSVITNADGSAKFESILLPKSGVLLSIAPATVQNMNDVMEGELEDSEFETMSNGLQQYKIFYGILNKEVDWKGAKANSGAYKDSNTGKMGAGMYATMDRDVQLLLNPTDVDATTYDFAFASTDNTPLWGLSFKTPQPYVGKMTAPILPDMTRAASSTNGIWTLPRNVEYVADLSGNHNRANYVQQFKKNDKDYYLLALTAKTNIQDANAQNFFKETKSQYIYAFVPKNIDKVKINDEESKFDYSKTTEHFEIGKEYRPSFENMQITWEEWEVEAGLNPFYTTADSALIYDYYITPNMKLETAQTIATYGITISEDGYSFSATKDAAVNNTVNFVFHYILLNGNTGEIPFAINFGKNAASNVQFELPAINEAFNAVDLFNKDYKTDNDLLYPKTENTVYGLSKTISLDGFFAQLGEDGKADWIDALARVLARPTDDNEVVSSDLLVFSSDYVELSGGDPINNADDVNEYLYNNFIKLDYVDANGKSVIFKHGKLNEDAYYKDKDGKVDLSKLNNIAALKITFLAIPGNGPVLPPYYTSDGEKANLERIIGDNVPADQKQKVALPLYNEFNLAIKTTKAQYVVSTLNVRFELKMPGNCLITREVVKEAHTATWYKSEEAKEYNDVLKVYGEMNPTSGVVYADLRDAFGGAFTEYSNAYRKSTPQAAWYKMEVAEFPIAGARFIGETATETPVALSSIVSENVYTKWNTYAPATAVMALYRQPGTSLEARKSFKITNITYDHFGVYRQDTAITKKWNIDNNLELRDFSVVFGSKIEDAQEIAPASKDMIEAKAVYRNGVLDKYTVTLNNSHFKLKDAFGAPFYLFDTDKPAKRGTLAGTDFIPERQGIYDLNDNLNYPNSINSGYYGLYPIVLDGNNTPVGNAVVTMQEVYPDNEVNAAKIGQVGQDLTKLVHVIGLKLTFKPNVGNNRPFDVVFNIADVFAVKAGLGIRQDNNSQSDLWNIYRRLEDADKGALTPLVASNELRFQVKTVNNPE